KYGPPGHLVEADQLTAQSLAGLREVPSEVVDEQQQSTSSTAETCARKRNPSAPLTKTHSVSAPVPPVVKSSICSSAITAPRNCAFFPVIWTHLPNKPDVPGATSRCNKTSPSANTPEFIKNKPVPVPKTICAADPPTTSAGSLIAGVVKMLASSIGSPFVRAIASMPPLHLQVLRRSKTGLLCSRGR